MLGSHATSELTRAQYFERSSKDKDSRSASREQRRQSLNNLIKRWRPGGVRDTKGMPCKHPEKPLKFLTAPLLYTLGSCMYSLEMFEIQELRLYFFALAVSEPL